MRITLWSWTYFVISRASWCFLPCSLESRYKVRVRKAGEKRALSTRTLSFGSWIGRINYSRLTWGWWWLLRASGRVYPAWCRDNAWPGLKSCASGILLNNCKSVLPVIKVPKMRNDRDIFKETSPTLTNWKRKNYSEVFALKIFFLESLLKQICAKHW